jgi:hypothetical protein
MMFFGVLGWINGGSIGFDDATYGVALTSTTGGICDGNWHHIVGLSPDSSHLHIYIDGQDAGELANDSRSLSNYIEVEIGRRGTCDWSPDSYFHGDMDDVRIYDRALSADEVAGLYYCGHGTNYPAPALTVGGTNLVVKDGKVGIGTNAPSEALEVVGNVVASGSVKAQSFTGDGAGITGLSGGAIAAGSVSNAQLAAGVVTAEKLSSGAVGSASLSDGAVSASKLDSSVDARYVGKAGDSMTGALQLPANGLIVGANQLVVTNGNVSTAGNMTAAGTARFDGGIVHVPELGGLSMGSFTNGL